MLTLQNFVKERIELMRSGRVATCWKIEQQLANNSATYRFTDWPETLLVAEGNVPGVTQTYTPTDGLNGSARRRDVDLSQNNFETQGIISSTAIKHEDLVGRKFDNAKITEYLVLVDVAWKGVITFDVYYIDTVKFDGQVWQAQCKGVSSQIGEAYGELWSPTCRVEVFSQGPGKCNANPAAWTFTSDIGTIYEDRLSFLATDLNAPDTTLADGKLIWTSGKNAGFISEVKTQTLVLPAGHSNLTLQTRTPLPFTLGDTFTVTAGCNKLPGIGESAANGHCLHRYNNLINFQGEPTIPGRDAAVRGSRLV